MPYRQLYREGKKPNFLILLDIEGTIYPPQGIRTSLLETVNTACKDYNNVQAVLWTTKSVYSADEDTGLLYYPEIFKPYPGISPIIIYKDGILRIKPDGIEPIKYQIDQPKKPDPDPFHKLKPEAYDRVADLFQITKAQMMLIDDDEKNRGKARFKSNENDLISYAIDPNDDKTMKEIIPIIRQNAMPKTA